MEKGFKFFSSINKFIYILGIVFFVMCFAFIQFLLNKKTNSLKIDPLTLQERQWLQTHPVIKLAPDPNYMPIEFFDAQKHYTGIAADFTKLLEDKLNIKFQFVNCNNWDEVLEKARNREVDVLGNAAKINQPNAFLLFSQPYLSFPSVVISRSDYKGNIQVNNLAGKRVSIVSGYDYQQILSKKYPGLKIDYVPDIVSGLRKVSFNGSDLFINDLATSSYYIQEQGISNLKITGEIEIENNSGYAVRNDWPELITILNKGLKLITEQEKSKIYNKWVVHYNIKWYQSKTFKFVLFCVAIVFLIIFLYLFFWSRNLIRQVKHKTSELAVLLSKKTDIETEFRKSEDKYNDLVQKLNEAIYRIKIPEAVFEYFSPASEAVFGISFSKLYEKNSIANYIHPDYESYYYQEWQNLLDGKVTSTWEYKIIDSLGNERWIFQTNAGIFDNDQRLIAMESCCSDITDRKMAELEILVEKEKNQITLSAINDAVIITNSVGRITLMNKVAERLTGWVFNEVQNKYIHEIFFLVNERTREMVTNPIEHILTNNINSNQNENPLLISRAGIEIPIEENAIPILDHQQKILGVILVFRDVREKRKMEENLNRSLKMESVGILAGGIAHDFNNILTAILGNISFLKYLFPQEEKSFEMLLEAENAAFKAKGLTAQLQSLAKGGLPIKVTTTIKDILFNDATFAIRGSNILMDFSLSDDLWNVDIDIAQISHVIHNLVINARQAMQDSGNIRIIGENIVFQDDNEFMLAPGKYIKVAVMDDGPGMDSGVLEKIFDPYFTTKQSGTGIGLSSVENTIKNHNGYIGAWSEFGVGSVFTFYLPASDLPVKFRVAEVDWNNIPPIKILVLEDDEKVNSLLASILEYMNFQGTFTTDGYDTIDQFKGAISSNHPYDIVLLDLTIPGKLGGKDTIVKLLEIDPNLKAIVTSGYSNDAVMANYREHGFKSYLTKPYRIEDFISVIQETLNS